MSSGERKVLKKSEAFGMRLGGISLYGCASLRKHILKDVIYWTFRLEAQQVLYIVPG